MLLRDFFDGTELKDRLIAAYLIGTSIKEDYFKELKPMYNPKENKGYVSWNTYRRKKNPRKNDPAYFSWKNNSVVVNPITWDNSISTELDQHKGFLFYDKKIYPNTIKIKVFDGIVWSNVPRKIPKRILFSFVNLNILSSINLAILFFSSVWNFYLLFNKHFFRGNLKWGYIVMKSPNFAAKENKQLDE